MSRGLVVGQSAQHSVSPAPTLASPEADTTGPTRRPTFHTPPTDRVTHYLYIHVAADGSALYVGLTRFPANRTKHHDACSEWFGQVDEIVWYPTTDRRGAWLFESEIIAALQPPNNVRHTVRDKTLGPRPSSLLPADSAEQAS